MPVRYRTGGLSVFKDGKKKRGMGKARLLLSVTRKSGKSFLYAEPCGYLIGSKLSIKVTSYLYTETHDHIGKNMKNEIVPWKCHCCGQVFDIIGGGICKYCGQPTCNICFGLGKVSTVAKFKIPDSRCCRACSKVDQEKNAAKK